MEWIALGGVVTVFVVLSVLWYRYTVRQAEKSAERLAELLRHGQQLTQDRTLERLVRALQDDEANE